MRTSFAHSRRRGAVLLMALFVVIMVGGLSMAFLRVGMAFNSEHHHRIEDERALFVAEAGLEEGLFALRHGDSGDVASRADPACVGNGLLWVETGPVATDILLMRSVGLAGGGRTALERAVFVWYDDPFTTALFSDESFTIESQTLIDSYDSTLGTYAAQLAASPDSWVDEAAIIQSNNAIALDSSVEVHGDLHPGTGSYVTIPGSSSVSGSTQASPQKRTLDPVSVPVIPSMGALLAPSGGVTDLAPGDYNFSSLVVGSGTFEIVGPARVVLGDFVLDSNTELILDASAGPIDLYVGGTVKLASNSTITTTTGAATDIALNLVGGPDQVAELRSNSAFHGTIYAPEGTVDIRSNFEIFGSVAADRLIVNANARVHYDEALRNRAAGGEQYIVSAWSQAGVPDQDLLRDRRDATLVLGVDPVALRSPGEAHE